jgi:uncharacterized membrane protein
MKWILLSVALLVVLVAVIAIIGACLPRVHTATRRATYAKPAAQLYGIVRDFAAAPSWRSGLKSIEILSPREGRVCFRETSAHGPITYVVIEDRPGEKLTTEIADRDLPFGGTWTFEFFPANGTDRAELRITERGEIKNALFRFMARFVFGYTATIDTYLRDLGRKLGETTNPEP